VIIDEIDKMECLSSLFRKAVPNALDSQNPVLASLAEKGGPFIESIKSREDIELHRILVSNRNSLADTVPDGMRRRLKPKSSIATPPGANDLRR
jgi:nucleoside-triphosphatase